MSEEKEQVKSEEKDLSKLIISQGELAKTIITVDTFMIGFFAAILGLFFTSDYFQELHANLYLFVPIWLITTVMLFLISIIAILNGLAFGQTPEGMGLLMGGTIFTFLGFIFVFIGFLIIGFVISIISGIVLTLVAIGLIYLFRRVYLKYRRLHQE